jgi:hypothetical protein
MKTTICFRYSRLNTTLWLIAAALCLAPGAVWVITQLLKP